LAAEHPYDISHQFRLVAIDYEGTEWACGWTFPELKEAATAGWLLTGELNSLVTHVTGPWVSPDCGVELLYDAELELPMDKQMLSVVSIEGEEIARRWSQGQKTIPVLGTEITFSYPPFGTGLSVTARTSEMLCHPYLENWISEPLRIMLGQLIFPRLVVRNFGNGTADVWLRPSPRRFRNPVIASLAAYSSANSLVQFWNLYAPLLTLIAQARDKDNRPNFESHPVTRFYDEITQATQGSRWVLCMTLASSAEGLALLLMTPAQREPEFANTDIASLRDVIKAWQGNEALKNRVLSWFSRLGERSVPKFLRDLVRSGVLTKDNERDWSAVRNAVMHGNLVSPWATEEEDKRIRSLVDLAHRLTHELIRACVEVKATEGIRASPDVPP
jgi:hypothetical protein